MRKILCQIEAQEFQYNLLLQKGARIFWEQGKNLLHIFFEEQHQ